MQLERSFTEERSGNRMISDLEQILRDDNYAIFLKFTDGARHKKVR